MELALEAEPTAYVPIGTPAARDGGGIAPLPIDHVTLNVPGIDEIVDFVSEHLGFRLTEAVVPRPDFTRLAFTRCRDHHHDLAFIDPGHGHPAALNHVAFRVTTLEQLVRACDIVAELGGTLDASPGRHMIGDHVYTYFRDPSGNRIELSWGMAKIDPAAEPRIHVEDTFDLWREGFPPLMRA
jgi:catechol 2,3-dioxygenase-like lactoylglutathione lyase family enzyme